MIINNKDGEEEMWVHYPDYQETKLKLNDAKNYTIPILRAQIDVLKAVLELHSIEIPAELKLIPPPLINLKKENT